MFGIKTILYSIDIINREYCSGWCFHRLFRNAPVRLSFYQDDKLIASGIADAQAKIVNALRARGRPVDFKI